MIRRNHLTIAYLLLTAAMVGGFFRIEGLRAADQESLRDRAQIRNIQVQQAYENDLHACQRANLVRLDNANSIRDFTELLNAYFPPSTAEGMFRRNKFQEDLEVKLKARFALVNCNTSVQRPEPLGGSG